MSRNLCEKCGGLFLDYEYQDHLCGEDLTEEAVAVIKDIVRNFGRITPPLAERIDRILRNAP